MTNDEKAALIHALKSNKIIRFCVYPYQNTKRLLMRNYYRSSKHSKKLMTLKNIHKGQRCFIIGNGPSLNPNDLDKITDEYAFAANGIFHMFDKTSWRPTFYTCSDPEAFLIYKDMILASDTEYKFICLLCGIPKSIDSSIYPIYHYSRFTLRKHEQKPSPFFSEGAEKNLSPGATVTFTNIQLAVYMGFSEIYLLGVDHSYAHYRDESGRVIENSETKNSYYEGAPCFQLKGIQNPIISNKAYKVAREYADSHNIKIYNATRGGKLEIFERISFDDIEFSSKN